MNRPFFPFYASKGLQLDLTPYMEGDQLGFLDWDLPIEPEIFSIWLRLGYNIVLFLAGLQAIPRDLYEAASVDGANSWAQFRHVTLPLLSPTTFLILILSLISSFQVFDQVLVMTGQSQPGGPRGAAITMVFYIYTNAFRLSRMGYASAIALVLFLIIFVITIVQLRLQRRWVYYD